MSRPGIRWGTGYLVALFLVAAPATDLLLRASPLRPTVVGWRYGVAGFFSRSMGVMFLGLLLAMFVAAILNHRRTLWALTTLAFVGAVALLGTAGLFALDGLQLRSTVNETFRRPFDLAALIALSKYGVGAITAILFGWAGVRVVRHAKPRDSEGAPLVASARGQD